MSRQATIRFSVILPAYNAAGTIRIALASVLAQTYPAFEVIVVNDGSTDDTEQVIKGFGDAVTYIALPANAGPAHARNAALQIIRGNYVAFQDADDTWHPEKLAVLAGIIVAHPDAGFIYHPYTLAPIDFKIPPGLSLRRYSFSRLLISNPIGTPCVVMRYRPDIRFSESMHYMEDYDLFLREGYRQVIYFLDLPLTRLGRPILSEGGQSERRWKMRRGEFRAYLNLIRLNPLFLLISFPLIVFGLLKHAVKSFFPPRSNY